jgi:hypothetical protein
VIENHNPFLKKFGLRNYIDVKLIKFVVKSVLSYSNNLMMQIYKVLDNPKFLHVLVYQMSAESSLKMEKTPIITMDGRTWSLMTWVWMENGVSGF